jgi:hypothetical protein
LEGADVLWELDEAEEVRLAVEEEVREDDRLALSLLLDALAEDALALEELADAELALEPDADEADALLLKLPLMEEEAALAVLLATEAVLVAPWTWKPPEKL